MYPYPDPESISGKIIRRAYIPVWFNSPPHPNSIACRMLKKMYVATVVSKLNPNNVNEYKQRKLSEEKAYQLSLLQQIKDTYGEDADFDEEWLDEGFISHMVDWYEEEPDML